MSCSVLVRRVAAGAMCCLGVLTVAALATHAVPASADGDSAPVTVRGRGWLCGLVDEASRLVDPPVAVTRYEDWPVLLLNEALADGSCDIAATDERMPLDRARTAMDSGIFPVPHCLAYNVIVVFVHPTNTVDDITVAQLRDVFAGRIQNWSALGGADAPIMRVGVRYESSRSRRCLRRIVMQGEEMMDETQWSGHGSPMDWYVRTEPNGIGYSMAGFTTEHVKLLSIGGVHCSEETVRSGRYVLSAPLLVYTDGYPKIGSPVQRLIAFFYSESGADLIRAWGGLVPVTDYARGSRTG